MEMTAAGLLPATVVDNWIAELWVQIIKGLKLHPKAAMREGAEIAWAVRPDNPKLLETLNRAIAEIAGNANQWSSRTRSYLAELKQLLPPAKVEYVEKQPSLEDVFFAVVGHASEDEGDGAASGSQDRNTRASKK